MKAFQIKVDGKILDYRKTETLNLEKVNKYFARKYRVIKLWQEQRHVLGIVEKANRELFLKLATTEGIGVVTQIEYNWNAEFNRLVPRNSKFWVPQNRDSGFTTSCFIWLPISLRERGWRKDRKRGSLTKILKSTSLK